MIRCPNCGAFNPDSRKSCKNCGATLPQTKIRCPNCGTLNPIGNVLCDNCNARLIDAKDVVPPEFFEEPGNGGTRHRGGPSQRDAGASKVKGISLPTRSPGDDEPADEDLPDWLRGLSPGTEAYDEDFEATAPTDADDTDTYPDWLSDLLEDNSETGDALELGEPLPAEEVEPDELALDANALPDWFADAAAYAEAEEQASAEEPGEAEAALPDWLTALADSESAAPIPSREEEPPDWLYADATETPADQPADVGELPDWLADTAAESEDEVEAAPEAETVESEPLLFAESELPDWLAEAQRLSAEVSPAAAASQPARTPLERDLASLLDSEPAEASDADAAPELPDWLLESEAEAEIEAELPEWLTTLAAEEEGAGDSLETPPPATTSPGAPPAQVAQPPQQQAVEEATGAAEQEAAPELEEAELPDWLADLGVEPAELGETAAVFGAATPVYPDLAPAERPSWLDGVVPPEAEADAPEQTPAFLMEDLSGEEGVSAIASSEEPVDIPEWLRRLDLAPAETPTVPMPPPAREDDSLARAELPSWLQELAPAELAIEAAGAEVFDVTDELVSADIPDWVRALQPSPGQERTAPPPSAPLPTPAEPEGPLEGLPGVLQPLATVDAPSGVHPAAEVSIPETVTSQAQLWQQLLEQPRMAERPVFHERQQTKEGTLVVRLLVAAILVLGMLGAFWLLPQGIRLSDIVGSGQTGSPETTAPGAERMVETLAGLQPGDGVILAVEYGNAYAEEMAEIAMPILAHLDGQEVVVEFVSTLPEGVVLGTKLSRALQNAPSPPETSYLAGNASGISSYLARPEITTRRHLLLLSSSPERVRWWLEQVTLANQERAIPLTVSVGVSASTGPRVAPYLQTQNIQGWLVGMPDALVYRSLRNSASGSSADSLSGYGRIQDILTLGHWAAGAFLIIGLLVNLGRRSTRGSAKKGGR